MTGWKKKRFWEHAEVAAIEGGHEVLLDGRKLRTPSKSALIVPSNLIAERIAQEWQSQEGEIAPDTMPVTRMANSAIDKVAPQFEAVAELIAAYGETDLLCYRATFPVELVAQQTEVWTPYIEWAKNELDVPLELCAGVMFAAQPQASIAKLRARVFDLSAFELAAFHDLVAISGSLVLGLAAIEAWKSPEEIWDASRLDENWQESQWGEDDEAVDFALKKKQGFMEAIQFYQGLSAKV